MLAQWTIKCPPLTPMDYAILLAQGALYLYPPPNGLCRFANAVRHVSSASSPYYFTYAFLLAQSTTCCCKLHESCVGPSARPIGLSMYATPLLDCSFTQAQWGVGNYFPSASLADYNCLLLVIASWTTVWASALYFCFPANGHRLPASLNNFFFNVPFSYYSPIDCVCLLCCA